MFGLFKSKKNKDTTNASNVTNNGSEKKPREKRIPEKKLSAKDLATRDNQPYIEIVSFNVDTVNPRYGAFELDWNDIFIFRLREAGYTGTDDEIIDVWFSEVCDSCANDLIKTNPSLSRFVTSSRQTDGRVIVK